MLQDHLSEGLRLLDLGRLIAGSADADPDIAVALQDIERAADAVSRPKGFVSKTAIFSGGADFSSSSLPLFLSLSRAFSESFSRWNVSFQNCFGSRAPAPSPLCITVRLIELVNVGSVK